MAEAPVRVPEQPTFPAPEQGPVGVEGSRERPVPAVDRAPTGAAEVATVAVPLPVPMPVVAPAQPNMTRQVEEILSAGLEETYKKMDPVTQAKFRTAGEQAAAQISVLLQSAKFQVSRVIELIVRWLQIIPGVNRFFLEQEAKIKADQILTLRQPPPQ